MPHCKTEYRDLALLPPKPMVSRRDLFGGAVIASTNTADKAFNASAIATFPLISSRDLDEVRAAGFFGAFAGRGRII
jgi:hypothetical protein